MIKYSCEDIINRINAMSHVQAENSALFYKEYIEGTITSIPWESFFMPITSINNYAFSRCTSLASVTIPDSVTSIGDYAFRYCESLQSVTIPDSVTSIGDYAFFECTSLESITVDADNQYYSSDEYGVLFNKDKTTLIQYPIGNTRTAYTIPDSVTSIGVEAFSRCTSLASVTIPDSVTSIGNYAFYDCTSLESVTFKGTPSTLHSTAFNNCTNLTSIYVPWSADEVSNAPWGATNATIYYDTQFDEDGNIIEEV